MSSISTFRIPGSVVLILQSSNGLLLYYSINSSDLKVLNLHVYNPTTGNLRTIPSIQRSFISAALAFDPHISSKGYKVISIHTMVSADHYTLKIYSSETVLERSGLPLDMEVRNSVFWRGAILWVCESEYSFCLEVDKERVMKCLLRLFPVGKRAHEVLSVWSARGSCGVCGLDIVT
ncbi:hypothetical protein BVRB_2g030420 [Beta vulgaris subsp. vulgaris]|nr:hypothetical protein BVRB_2g030420 [Beta vulgaris subsp. vulgaris]